MRKILMIGLPLVAVAAIAGIWLVFGHAGDRVAAARARMARGDMRGAALYLTQEVRANPKNAEAAYLLGTADLALNNPAAAQQEFLRARADGYAKAAVTLKLGQAYLQQRHFAEVLRDFDPATALPETLPDVLSLRAAAQMALRDLDAAAATIAQAEKLAPRDAEVLLTSARIALASGNLDSAADRAAKVLQADPKPDEVTRGDALLLQAEIALRRNDSQTALARARTVLGFASSRLDARLMAARALASLGHEDEARRDVETVLHGAPHDVPANYLRALLAIHDGDFAAADASLQQTSAVISDLPRGDYFLAVTKLGLGQTAQAEEAATRFLGQHPDDISGLKLMTFIDLASHHPDHALGLLDAGALAAHPDSDTLDLRGRALAMQGDLNGARDNFAKASTLDPKDIHILNRLAAVELNLGDSQAGVADLQHSLALAPGQRLAGEAIVQAALARGDLDAARQGVAQLRASRTTAPEVPHGGSEGGDSEDVGVLDAQVKMAALDMEGAAAELRALLQRYPDSRAATLLLARIEGLQGDSAGAEALLEAALRKHPTDTGLLDLLLPALFAQDQTARAIKLAQLAHDASPDNSAVTASLAGAYVRGKQPDRAVGLLDRASAGSNPDLDFLRARVLAGEGKIAVAKTVLQAILDRAPNDIRARAALAQLLAQEGDADAARAILRDGLKQSPGNPALMAELVRLDLKGPGGMRPALATAAALRAVPANLPAALALPGAIYLSAGDTHGAAAAFAAAYKTAPSSELALQAAATLAVSGNAAQAIALLQGWTAKNPQDLAAQSVLSSLYLNAGRLDDAASGLTLVLASRPADSAALNNLAWIRQRQGDAAQAKSLAQRAYFQSPRPEMADTLGWILQQQGDTTQALKLLKQATAAGNPAARAAADYHYAVALAARGEKDQAKAQAQAALDLKADFREKDDAEKLLGRLTE